MNTRLAAAEVAYILERSGASVLIHDPELDEFVGTACAQLTVPPTRIRASADYEQRLAAVQPYAVVPRDERSLLSINYTSGTTGRPKGVMYHHRGAYLQAVAMVGHPRLSPSAPVDVRDVPLQRLVFPWAVTAAAGTHVCLPKPEPAEVCRLIREEDATHLNGAPTVLSMLAYAEEAAPLAQTVHVATGGAPPSPAILRRMHELWFEVTQLYGLTETYGPMMVCDWRPEWN